MGTSVKWWKGSFFSLPATCFAYLCIYTYAVFKVECLVLGRRKGSFFLKHKQSELPYNIVAMQCCPIATAREWKAIKKVYDHHMAYGHETWWIVHEAREIRSKNTTSILCNTRRPSEANAPFWLSLPNIHPGSPLACIELCALHVFWVRSNNQQTVSFFSLSVFEID